MAEKEFKHIVRIANADLPGEKPIIHALTKIKGVKFMMANAVCNLAEVDRNKKAGELSEADIKKISEVLKNPSKFNLPDWMLNRRKDYETGENKHLFGGDLDFIQEGDVKIMKKIKSYRGVRHIFGLPVRGQRTRANFRKGKSLGVAKGKKKPGRV